jgi:hypothetical protein
MVIYYHIDPTYKCNIKNYALYSFLVQDSRLRGLPVCFSLMRRETIRSMDFMYEQFSLIMDTGVQKTEIALRHRKKPSHYVATMAK